MFVVQIFHMLVRTLHLIGVHCIDGVMFARSSEDCRKVYGNSFDSFIVPTLNLFEVLFNDRSSTDSMCTGKQMCAMHSET